MSATNATETAILELIFKATTWASVAQNASSAPYTSYYLSLHSANPGEGGSQNTSEAAYTGYARVAVTRDGTGWTVSGNQASNTALVTFAKCTANPETLTYVGIGSASSGAGVLLLYNALDVAVDVVVGATPLFEAGALVITCD